MSLRELFLLFGGGVLGLFLGWFWCSRRVRKFLYRFFGMSAKGSLEECLRVLAERKAQEKGRWLRECLVLLNRLLIGGAFFFPEEQRILLNSTFSQAVGLRGEGVREVQVFELPVFGEAILQAFALRKPFPIAQLGLLLSPIFLDDICFILLEDERKKTQRLRNLRYFLTALWHEFQTPLTVLSGYVSALEEGLPLEGEVLSRMVRQIRRLEGVIREMQRLSLLLEGGKDHIPCGTFFSILERVVTEYKGERSDLALAIDVTRDSGYHFLSLSEGEAFVLLSNLVANAFAFTLPQGEVRISASCRDSGLFLSLENTASLPDAEFLSWFFDPTDALPRGGSGKGVGLYLVREVVEENGGEIRLRTQGNRVTFEVFLNFSAPR